VVAEVDAAACGRGAEGGELAQVVDGEVGAGLGGDGPAVGSQEVATLPAPSLCGGLGVEVRLPGRGQGDVLGELGPAAAPGAVGVDVEARSWTVASELPIRGQTRLAWASPFGGGSAMAVTGWRRRGSGGGSVVRGFLVVGDRGRKPLR
jgi:hypothetical protein